MASAQHVHDMGQLILTLRGQRVILDADLAALYNIPTKALNQAVKRNADRFPSEFAFQLAAEELAVLRSQFAASSFNSNQRDLRMNRHRNEG